MTSENGLWGCDPQSNPSWFRVGTKLFDPSIEDRVASWRPALSELRRAGLLSPPGTFFLLRLEVLQRLPLTTERIIEKEDIWYGCHVFCAGRLKSFSPTKS